MNDYVEMLNGELKRRVRVNPAYSLRSFARSLKIDPGNLSKILTAKAKLSRPAAYRIVDALQLNPKDQRRFVESVEAHHNSRFNAPKATKKPAITDIDHVWYEIMGDWYH